jgi:hypothetical protein
VIVSFTPAFWLLIATMPLGRIDEETFANIGTDAPTRRSRRERRHMQMLTSLPCGRGGPLRAWLDNHVTAWLAMTTTARTKSSDAMKMPNESCDVDDSQSAGPWCACLESAATA